MFEVGKLFGVRGAGEITLHPATIVSPMIVKAENGTIFIKKPDGRFLCDAQRNTLAAGVLEALPRDHPDVVEQFGPAED